MGAWDLGGLGFGMCSLGFRVCRMCEAGWWWSRGAWNMVGGGFGDLGFGETVFRA